MTNDLIRRLFSNPAWMADAPCRGATTAFYGPDNQGGDPSWAANAKAVCHKCPHRVRCLEWAIDNNEDHGIWGGLSVRERRVIARNRRALGWTTGSNVNVMRADVA